jgi:phenylalanine-4-hydroxylase
MERHRPDKQIYEDYTPENLLVWQTLFNRQMMVLKDHASADFLKSLRKIGFSALRIPDFSNVNLRLKSMTGWKLRTVPCLSPIEEFFQLLTEKEFTATCWLRNFEELDYIEEPDMFHDVFGHAPLLTHPDYCAFFQQLGEIACRYKGIPEGMEKLQRLYWFTIEFGMIKENSELKIYGAGIISSKEETAHALTKDSIKHPFDVRTMMNQPFRTDIIQENYYVLKSFEQLRDSIPEIESELARTIELKKTA